MEEVKGTKIFTKNEIRQAAKLLKKGELVAFPTETVYGLGANALNEKAVKGIFKAKGRPADNPLIVHIAEIEEVEKLIAGKLSKKANKLIDKFWPGPLTIVLSRNERVPKITTGGLDTVAIRMPDHLLALELIKEAKVPIAAPSANISGKPSPTLAQHVVDDLAGKISAVIKGGQTGIGVESTVIDLSREAPVLLRPGGVTYEELVEVLGKIKLDAGVEVKATSTAEKPLSPGMKYKHYSPQAEVILVEGDAASISKKIQKLVNSSTGELGVMATSENINKYSNCFVKNMGDRNNLKEISNNIFKLLREFDDEKVDKIFVEGLPQTGLGLAIMNRLRKAAGGRVVKT